MTECQGCGAWNDASRTLCVLCGTPLAETDEWDAAAELPPLPPLPDGGLSASMPTWLREPPRPAPSPPPPPLGPHADPRTFLSDDDFPRWLHDLAARDAVESGKTAAIAPPPAGHETTDAGASQPDAAPPLAVSLPASDLPDSPIQTIDAVPAPGGDGRAPTAAVAARAREERHERSVWETLLLVILGLGVVAAALWALIANGAFGPAL